MQIFLLIGQSKLEGVPQPELADQQAYAQVKALAFDDTCKAAPTILGPRPRLGFQRDLGIRYARTILQRISADRNNTDDQ